MKQSIRLFLGLIIIYGLLYIFLFWQTPLGQTAVLDGAENIFLSKQIYNGTLPKEPFFRSMLYPAFLSLSYFIGIEDPDKVFKLASFWGLICHFISTFLIFLSCKNLWKNDKLAIIASLIYGIYPPAVFFACEPLDTTISITFMLASLLFFFEGVDTNLNAKFLYSGLLLGTAVLLRSNLLPFGIIYITFNILKKDRIKQTATAILAVAFMLLINSCINFLHSGQLRFLPWQGALNIYSANCLKANGKYYRQTIQLPDRSLGTNPSRAEAELIYSKETGENPPFDLVKFNHFWFIKAKNEIISNPISWLKLICKKTYYLFNNFEQYNNKSFSFHKSANPVLRFNPICFGIILVLFFISFTNRKDQSFDEIKIYCLLSAIFFLSLGIVFFYVSSRFRLPIVSLLLIIGVGVFRNKFKNVLKLENAVIASFCCFISFTSFFDAKDTSTWKEDKLLNAFACSRLGYDQKQLYWADQVLEEEPQNIQAIRLKIVAFTNLALAGGKNLNQLSWDSVCSELEYLTQNNLYYNDCLLLLACYNYKIKQNPHLASKILEKGVIEPNDLFTAFLVYADLISANKINLDSKALEKNPFMFVALHSSNPNIKFSYQQENVVKIYKFLLE